MHAHAFTHVRVRHAAAAPHTPCFRLLPVTPRASTHTCWRRSCIWSAGSACLFVCACLCVYARACVCSFTRTPLTCCMQVCCCLILRTRCTAGACVQWHTHAHARKHTQHIRAHAHTTLTHTHMHRHTRIYTHTRTHTNSLSASAATAHWSRRAPTLTLLPLSCVKRRCCNP